MSEKSKKKIRLVPSFALTDRLIIKDTTLDECEALQQLSSLSDYIENWVGWKTPPDYAYKTLAEGNLPPDGEKEYFKVQSIYLATNSELIGSVELYHGYPNEQTLCIGWLFIHPEHQKCGYAREVLGVIFREAVGAGFRKLQLGVHLKNWPALRFWVQMGFDKIEKIVGDACHSESTFASVILSKSLE